MTQYPMQEGIKIGIGYEDKICLTSPEVLDGVCWYIERFGQDLFDHPSVEDSDNYKYSVYFVAIVSSPVVFDL